jgi:anti-sigma-K factor RskA
MIPPTHGEQSRTDDDLLAAELILGALSDLETKAAHHRLETDARFARLVAQWRSRLPGPAPELPAAAPPPGLWERIAARIDRLEPPA